MSEVKVNKISPRSGTGVQLGDSGDTITIPAGATLANAGTVTGIPTSALTGTIALNQMATGTDGNIISYDASGNPVAVATGSAGQILTSAGAGAPPTFAAAASSNPYTAQSNTESGYIKLVGGVIIQWGVFGTFGIASSGTATFATTFPSNLWSLTVGLWNNNTNNLYSLVVTRTPTTSQFDWYQNDTGNTGRVGSYIAVGK